MSLRQRSSSARENLIDRKGRRAAALKRASEGAARAAWNGHPEPLEQRIMLAAVDPVIRYNFDDAAGTLVVDSAPDGILQNGTLAVTPLPTRDAPGHPVAPGAPPNSPTHLNLD